MADTYTTSQNLMMGGNLALTGYQAYQGYAAGQTAKSAYNKQANEIKIQQAVETRLGLEEMREVDREATALESQLRAGAGKAGVRVAGSVSTRGSAILRAAERRKGVLGLKLSESIRRTNVQVDRLRTRGRAESKAAGLGAVSSLLTGGFQTLQMGRAFKKSNDELALKNKPKPTQITYRPH